MKKVFMIVLMVFFAMMLTACDDVPDGYNMASVEIDSELARMGDISATGVSIQPFFSPDERWARVDESIGLRATASIGTAQGVSGADTRIFLTRQNGIHTIPLAVDNPSLPISITPAPHYTLRGVTVVAFATIEHLDNELDPTNPDWGTREVVTDIRTWENLNHGAGTAWTENYIVPTEYFETFFHPGSRMEIEVVLYADLTYNPNIDAPANIDFTIDFGSNADTILINGTPRPWGGVLPPGMSWTGFDNTTIVVANRPISRGLRIDADALDGSVIKLTGMSGAIEGVRGAYHVLIEGDHMTPERQTIHLILDDLIVFPGIDATMENFMTLKSNSRVTTQISHFATLHGRVERYSGEPIVNGLIGTIIENTYTNPGTGSPAIAPGTGTRWANRSPLILSNVDAFVTLRGDNIIAHTDINNQHPGTTAIFVEAASSLIFTDASDGTLYARGAGCSSAIGTMHLPVGFIQIDGGTITAESADGAHQFAGIGHGGHSENQNQPQQSGWTGAGIPVADPMLRGIVINGGEVHALGHHYGIGGNGGSVENQNGTGERFLNPDIGPTYIVITGGTVQAEAGAGSGGSAIGFGYNNSIHHVRIGRMDRPDAATQVTAANWGYGAAISGNMRFYSGYTTAYSSQYAAAIGGNAISWATVAIRVESQVTQAATGLANHAEAGTPLTVFGGVVRSRSGAFHQRDLTTTGGSPNFHINQVRGVAAPGAGGTPPALAGSVIRPVYTATGLRISLQDLLNTLDESCCGLSFGAAVGGAIQQDGGTRNQIFGGVFDVVSGSHGAGIGGGGARNAGTAGDGTGDAPGDGTWFGTNHIRWNVPYDDLTTRGVRRFADFDITSGRYGAGIGGGGSDGPAVPGGDGGNIFIGGGHFNVTSGNFGAGIGGGGSGLGAGGDGGNVVIVRRD